MLSVLPTKWRSARIAVIGDCMLDRFTWGDATRISPEAPVPVVLLQHETYQLGGAANVAANVVSLGGRAALFSLVGADAAGEQVRALLRKQGIEDGLQALAAHPTTVKQRILAQGKHMLRLDQESDGELPAEALRELLTSLQSRLGEFDVIVISDYAKGTINQQTLGMLLEVAHTAGVPVLADPKQPRLSYAGVTLLKPNLKELEALVNAGARSDAELNQAAALVLERHACEALLVTLGARGMMLYRRAARVASDGDRRGGQRGEQTPRQIPALAHHVADVTGAGDTVMAALAMGMAAGLELAEAADVANCAASIAVSEPGTVAVTLADLEALMLSRQEPGQVEVSGSGGAL